MNSIINIVSASTHANIDQDEDIKNYDEDGDDSNDNQERIQTYKLQNIKSLTLLGFD